MRSAKRYLALLSAVTCLALTASPRSVPADENDRCDQAAKVGKVLLRVTSDADCKLTVNDEPRGALAANKERIVEAPSGKQVTRCTGSDGAVAQDEQRVDAGCGSVTFEVASAWRRFTAQKKGPLTDTETGLKWLPSDNGADVDWAGAKQYCAAKGGRLPTESELRRIHSGGAVSTKCGELSCMMSHLFRLSGRFFWSGTPFETNQAIVVGFAGPRPAVQSADSSRGKDVRALCVAGQ